MLWWFQRIGREGNGSHRDAVVVSEGPEGVRYSYVDEDGASREIFAADIGGLAHDKSTAIPWFSIALVVAAAVSTAMFAGLAWQAAAPFTVAIAIALVPLYNRQRRAKSLVIVYDRDSGTLTHRGATIDSLLRSVQSSQRSWLLANLQSVIDPRLVSGVGVSVRRLPLRPWIGAPLPIESNIALWSLAAPSARLIFLPDQLLVIASSRVAVFSYGDLRANFSNAEFVETEFALPSDATVIGWRAVHNKADGTPDRRFRNQATWPACAYSHLQFHLPSGVSLALITSNAAVAPHWNVHWPALLRPTSTSMRGYVAASSVSALAPAPVPHAASYAAPVASIAGLPPPPVIPPLDATFAATTSAPIGSGAGWSLYTQTTAQDRFSAVALLRYIAVADRKFSDDERAFILQATVELFGVAAHEAEAILANAPTQESEIASCAYVVAARGASLVRPLLEKLEQLPMIDGRATPKELERLAQVRAWLSA